DPRRPFASGPPEAGPAPRRGAGGALGAAGGEAGGVAAALAWLATRPGPPGAAASGPLDHGWSGRRHSATTAVVATATVDAASTVRPARLRTAGATSPART